LTDGLQQVVVDELGVVHKVREGNDPITKHFQRNHPQVNAWMGSDESAHNGKRRVPVQLFTHASNAPPLAHVCSFLRKPDELYPSDDLCQHLGTQYGSLHIVIEAWLPLDRSSAAPWLAEAGVPVA
jgi:hypothetical protein